MLLDFSEVDNSAQAVRTSLEEIIEGYDADGTFREEDVIDALRESLRIIERAGV